MATVEAAGVARAQIRSRAPAWAALLVALSLAATSCMWIDRASIEQPGSPIGTPRTDQPDLSAGGRFVAYQSDSPSLVPDDTNGASDVFVRDERTGTTERVSVGSSGEQADGSSFDPHLSADGRFVVFASVASNLVGIDTDQASDVFVHDRSTGGTRRVSDSSSVVAESPDISGDGRWIVYQSGRLDPRLLQFPLVLRYDLATGTSDVVSGGLGTGTGGATDASISDDGRYVAYTTYRAGGGPTGFLVPLAAVRDLAPSGPTVTVADPGRDATISGDGRSIAYVDDHLDGTPTQVLVVDRVTSARDLVSATASGQPSTSSSGQPSISGDGRFVVFASGADDLIDLNTGTVAQVYLRDRESRRTSLVSRDGLGAPADASAFAPSVAADGGYAAFGSNATNLSGGDLDGDADVFVTTTLEPNVTLAQPATLAPGTTTTVTITGGAFRVPLSVGIAGAQDVTFGPATVVSPTRIEVAVTVAPGAPPGPRVLVVVDLGTGPGPSAFAAGACQCLAVSP